MDFVSAFYSPARGDLILNPLDELASLNKLPQLHTAVTENRKYGNPVVVGFQGRSQLEKRYGQDAEVTMTKLGVTADQAFFIPLGGRRLIGTPSKIIRKLLPCSA